MTRKRSWTAAVFFAAVLLFAPWVAPADLTAQSEESHAAAAERIVQALLSSREGYGFPDDGGAWGLVVGRFATGDEKALEFRAGAGETYSIVGIGLDRADVDIRLIGPGGELIGEDVLDDHVPVVIFTAEASGVYRAVMSAAAVGSGGSYAGMVVLRPPAEEGACGSRR